MNWKTQVCAAWWLMIKPLIFHPSTMEDSVYPLKRNHTADWGWCGLPRTHHIYSCLPFPLFPRILPSSESVCTCFFVNTFFFLNTGKIWMRAWFSFWYILAWLGQQKHPYCSACGVKKAAWNFKAAQYDIICCLCSMKTGKLANN